ncbi:HINT3 protein, partial [Atractosteus spatula]|nr:HINT3 protein [Atractosteus spatula]
MTAAIFFVACGLQVQCLKMAASEGTAIEQSGSLNQTDGYEKKCIFCKIVNKEVDTEVIYFDEELACFKDIKPGAPHHYLVVPMKHIGNCKSLKKDHAPLVEKMVEVGKAILQKNGITDLNDIRLGFHWPPFCSVTHLHLHVLAPASLMGFTSRIFYRPDSYWFITVSCYRSFL